ncbi:MAG: glycoside hydrolase family 97 catalytic domain-containing protein [Verrucomicrobiia bacterium]
MQDNTPEPPEVMFQHDAREPRQSASPRLPLRNLGSTMLGMFVLAAMVSNAAEFSVKSPDGKLTAILRDGAQMTFSVKADGKLLLDNCKIGINTSQGTLGRDCIGKLSKEFSKEQVVENKFGIRRHICDQFNQIEVTCGTFTVLVRAYDEAVAYRFVSQFETAKELLVFDETLSLPLPDDTPIVAHYVNRDSTSFESVFTRDTIAGLKSHHSATIPLVIRKEGLTLLIAESDVHHYPQMRMAYPKDAHDGARAYFAKYPKALKLPNRAISITHEADGTEKFISKTTGSRAFPWRAFIVARNDAALADNETIFKLASPCALPDTSWISAGPCAWHLFYALVEDTDFPVGMNEKTARYYVDYASANRLPYVLIDAGWLTSNPNSSCYFYTPDMDEAFVENRRALDVEKVAAYAHSKGVKLMLWLPVRTFIKCGNAQVLDTIKRWGIDGLKVDFFDRDDQTAIELYESIARECAERKLVIDFHGCANPAGLNRTYPNALNFEGVLGGEFNYCGSKDKVITPSHNVDIVFTRMLLGPMDYTPGFLLNRTPDQYSKHMTIRTAMGTRAHQVAMFVLYLAPLQMLSSAPSEYKKYPDILKFVSSVPTAWDDTKVLCGEMGQYVMIARRKGDHWYVGALTNWDSRKLTVDFSGFLDAAKEYSAVIIRDGPNADKFPQNYCSETRKVSATNTMSLDVRKGGGFAVKLSPVGKQ